MNDNRTIVSSGERLSVRFDGDAINLRVEPPEGAAREEQIRWEHIVRVCFKSGGLDGLDEVHLFTEGRTGSYLIPTSADGGGSLWAEILRRNLFDALMAQEAAASPRREMFCSPLRTQEAEEDFPLYSPRQLPDLEGDALTLTWDQIGAETVITHGDRVVWRERTGWEVYDRFAEIVEILRHKYGSRLVDLAPTERSLYALYGDSSRALFHVASARQSLAEEIPEKPFPASYWLTLETAIREGDTETVKAYLARGGDPNIRSIVTASSDNALHVAARHRQPGIARMFIAAGANVNATDFFEIPPLVLALDTGRMPAAQPRGGGFRADPKALLIARTTALVKLLVYAGANLSGLSRPFSQLKGQKREMYRPPLSVAARNGYADALRFLIAQGAEIEAEDHFGDTPLITALRCGQPEPAHILIDAGADVTRMPYSPNQANETQLMMVVRSERFSPEEKVELLRRMVEAGADVNHPDATGDTPLIKVVRLGTDHQYAIIGFGEGDNVEWRVTKWPVYRKSSPEEVAALVRALLEAGADAGARDRDGKIAREIASEAGLIEVVRLL